MRSRDRAVVVWISWLSFCGAATAIVAPIRGFAESAPPRSSLTLLRDRAEPPAESPPSAEDGLGGAADLSSEGLTEVPGFTAAGGSTVSLGGRFRTAVGLRRSGSGQPVGECLIAPPASGSAD